MITEEIELETKLRWMEYCKEVLNIPKVKEIKLLNENDSSYARFNSRDLLLTSHKNPTLAQLCLKFREENTFQTA